METILNVHIGEVKIASNGETLRAILGSCVGIAFIWRQKGICGLSHCLLPKNPNSDFGIGGRYVDQAVESLFRLMDISIIDIRKIDAVVVGGANMTFPNQKDESKLIGTFNFHAAMTEVEKRGICIVHADGGGNLGRRITLGKQLDFNVDEIPRLSNVN